MAKTLGEHIKLNIPMYDDFETANPHFKPMQGRKDTDFYITLSKDGELYDVPSDCKVTATFLCYTKGSTTLADKYVISPTNEDGSSNPNYHITIVNNTIIIPADVAMTDFAGNIRMLISIDCTQDSGGISVPYVYKYEVEKVDGYKKVGGNINIMPYAKVDLSNVDPQVIKNVITEIDGGAA